MHAWAEWYTSHQCNINMVTHAAHTDRQGFASDQTLTRAALVPQGFAWEMIQGSQPGQMAGEIVTVYIQLNLRDVACNPHTSPPLVALKCWQARLGSAAGKQSGQSGCAGTLNTFITLNFRDAAFRCNTLWTPSSQLLHMCMSRSEAGSAEVLASFIFAQRPSQYERPNSTICTGRPGCR